MSPFLFGCTNQTVYGFVASKRMKHCAYSRWTVPNLRIMAWTMQACVCFFVVCLIRQMAARNTHCHIVHVACCGCVSLFNCLHAGALITDKLCGLSDVFVTFCLQ